MKVCNGCWAVIVLLVLSSSAVAGDYNEHKILSQSQGLSGPYILLRCTSKQLRFSIHWNGYVGSAGRYRRHLVLPGELGDTHILLKALADQTSTGIIDNDQQVKSLIKLILLNIETGYIVIKVFPEGSDEVTGEWESGSYDYKTFLDAVNAVAKECSWDMAKPIVGSVRTVNPGAPYDDK